MRLFEAIIEANHRAASGDTNAGLHPADFADALPIAALTCIDVRLNPLLPNVLGIPEEHFIWLRNAGNIITSATSSTMRSLSLACAVKGAEEIAIIGHTDCQVCKTTTLQLLERLKNLGIERHVLPDNVNEFFGMFGSERQNVIKACEIVRSSPLIGPKIPVHGLLLDIQTGRLEWLVNGYQAWATMGEKWNEVVRSAGETVDKLKSLGDFNIGEMKFPDTKIGETVTKATDWLSQKVGDLEIHPAEAPPTETALPPRVVNIAGKVIDLAEKHWPMPPEPRRRTSPPPKIPVPPPIRVFPPGGKKGK
ncbi:MAG: carbonic anhydrase [Verrucomicrobiota bacterium]